MSLISLNQSSRTPMNSQVELLNPKIWRPWWSCQGTSQWAPALLELLWRKVLVATKNQVRSPVNNQDGQYPRVFFSLNPLAHLAGRLPSQVRGREPQHCGTELYVEGGTLRALQVSSWRQLLLLPVNMAEWPEEGLAELCLFMSRLATSASRPTLPTGFLSFCSFCL